MKKRTLISLVVVLLLIASMAFSCEGQGSIRNGTLRDTIFSIEPKLNGTTALWMTHDDIATYCTLNPDIVKTATDNLVAGNDVIMHYKSINVGDPEYNFINGGCHVEGSSVQDYVIVSITKADGKY